MQILKFLGDLFIIFLVCVSVKGCVDKAHADTVPPYELVMATYAADTGHTISLRSYIDVLRAPYPTADACEDAREFVVSAYDSYRDRKTLSTHLLEAWCVKNPGGVREAP
jgi:hypothetical protein